MKTILSISLIGAIALSLVGYAIVCRGLRWSCNSQQFGPMITKPHYQSWFLRFSDGATMGPSGKLRSVVIDEKAGTMRYGYRLIPKFSHADMGLLLREHPEWKEVKP